MTALLFKEFFFLFPYLFLLTALVVALLFFPFYGFNHRTVGAPLAVQTSYYFILSALLFCLVFSYTAGSTQFFSGLENGSVQLCYVFLVLFIGFLSFFFYLSPIFASSQYEVVIFFFLVTSASFLLVTSMDLLVCYLALELQSLALYVLASSKTNSTFSTEAGLKYFVLGAFASSMLLFGIFLFYALLGTVSFIDAIPVLTSNLSAELQRGCYTACLLILVGLFFKVGAAPFHFWVPDVYAGASLPIFSFFALLPKVAVWGLLIKFTSYCNSFSYSTLVDILLILSFFSLAIGAYGGVIQISLKRIFAYSAIAQVGYLLLSLSFFSLFTFSSNFLYLLVYVTSLAPVLLILFTFSGRGRHPIVFDSIFIFRSLYKYSPLLAGFLLISVFSVAGVPPFSGFFSKIYLFLAAVWEGYYYFTLVSLFLSAASMVYYLRLVRVSVLLKAFRSWLFLPELGRPFSYFISFFTLINTGFLIVGGDFLSVLNFFCLTSFF